MHITKIEVSNLPPVTDHEDDFDLDARINLFIGPNATGKSTILRAIKRLHSMALSEEPACGYQSTGISSGDGRIEYVDSVNYINPGQVLAFVMHASDDWPRDDAGSTVWGELPFLYIPATRLSLPAQRVFEPNVFDQPMEESEGVRTDDLLNRLFDTEGGVFDGGYVGLVIERLQRQMAGDLAQQNSFRETLGVAYRCAQSICSEVISGDSPSSYVDRYETLDARRTVHHAMGIETSGQFWDKPQPLYAGALSSGTQGTLMWVYALALKMWVHYGSESFVYGETDKPAILLVDEIENHLHPTWQRRVIPALLQHFPGLQIFATTHSPFVVAGLKAGQVHLLKRDENGVVTATTHTEDIVGWTADEILRNVMGVEDPTDQRTVDRANRLRQLREKESLTAEEESELAELRRQVNEDLLSKSGQLGAQQERYADLMERFLLSRQSGPTQDGE